MYVCVFVIRLISTNLAREAGHHLANENQLDVAEAAAALYAEGEEDYVVKQAALSSISASNPFFGVSVYFSIFWVLLEGLSGGIGYILVDRTKVSGFTSQQTPMASTAW